MSSGIQKNLLFWDNARSFSDWKSSEKTKPETASPGWKSQSWVEKRLKQKVPTWQENQQKGEYWSKVVDALSLSDLIKHQQYNARNGSKIINWEIKNMPDGKQTIIVLWMWWSLLEQQHLYLQLQVPYSKRIALLLLL